MNIIGFLKNYYLSVLFIILLIVTVICVFKRRHKTYIWLLSASLFLYLVSRWSNICGCLSVIFNGLINPAADTILIFVMLIIFILLVLTLFFLYKKKMKICIWLLSAALLLYLISHWNTLIGFFV